MPRVSVIFPAHDREAFLEEAIESILAQTLKDFEFIIIDDGTGPVVSKMLGGYRARDPRCG